MKIRQGFVSNSSSSSFILTFSKPIETLDDLYDELNIDNISDWDKNDQDALEILFRDIQHQNKIFDVEEFYYNIHLYSDEEFPFMEKSCKQLFEEWSQNKVMISYDDDCNSKMENWMWALTKCINDPKKLEGNNDR